MAKSCRHKDIAIDETVGVYQINSISTKITSQLILKYTFYSNTEKCNISNPFGTLFLKSKPTVWKES